MTPPLSAPAQQLLASYDSATPVNAGELAPIADLATAAGIVAEIAAARVARGERRLGYKIGFTNRTIWARYGVHHPIWAPIYDSTVVQLTSPVTRIDIGAFVEPRLEPEIVIGLAHAPTHATPEAVARATAWVAHGFEIVQSAYPGWQFSGPQAFAAQGLHGRLLIGERHPVSSLCSDPSDLPGLLAKLSLSLYGATPERLVDQGFGHYVLDGPCHALAHLVAELAKVGQQLQAGDIITTGTITDAQPLAKGQRWRSVLADVPALAGLSLEVTTP